VTTDRSPARTFWASPPAEPASLQQCLMLALLLHVLLVALIGSAPAGRARPGEGVRGPLSVTLRGAPARQGRDVGPPAPAPVTAPPARLQARPAPVAREPAAAEVTPPTVEPQPSPPVLSRPPEPLAPAQVVPAPVEPAPAPVELAPEPPPREEPAPKVEPLPAPVETPRPPERVEPIRPPEPVTLPRPPEPAASAAPEAPPTPAPVPETAPTPAPTPAAAPAPATPAQARPDVATPDAGAKPGPDAAAPPSPPASEPRLNLNLPRSFGGSISSPGSRGVLNLMPRPPETKSKLAEDIEKAARKDCRNAHSDKGLLAVVPLAADALKGSGCKW